MNKILILQGIPASGKSTWARNFIKNNSEQWIIVNRDSIRDSLGNYWIPKRESLVTDIEIFSIRKGIEHGFNVIVDATNFNPKTVRTFQSLATEIGAEVSFKKFETSLKVSLWRDFWRGLCGGRKVGKVVIKRFYKQYIENKS